MPHAYPLMLDLRGKLVVVVGGGAVAVRKVTGLLAAGADRVRVVAPVMHADMPGGVERVVGGYSSEHLEGANLAFAATDSADVNDAVMRDARRQGILVNRADADESGGGSDFATPAVLRQGGVTVTVSTGGSPALAARVRDEIAARLDPAWGEVATASHSLRPRVMTAVNDAARRRDIFRALAGDDAVAAARAGGARGVEAWAGEAFPELAKGGRDA